MAGEHQGRHTDAHFRARIEPGPQGQPVPDPMLRETKAFTAYQTAKQMKGKNGLAAILEEIRNRRRSRKQKSEQQVSEPTQPEAPGGQNAEAIANTQEHLIFLAGELYSHITPPSQQRYSYGVLVDIVQIPDSEAPAGYKEMEVTASAQGTRSVVTKMIETIESLKQPFPPIKRIETKTMGETRRQLLVFKHLQQLQRLRRWQTRQPARTETPKRPQR